MLTISMDMNSMLGPKESSRLQATTDHDGPSMYSDHYTTSINCCEKTFYWDDERIPEYDMVDTIVLYKIIIQWVL